MDLKSERSLERCVSRLREKIIAAAAPSFDGAAALLRLFGGRSFYKNR